MIFSKLMPAQSLFFIFRHRFDVSYLKRPEPVRYKDSIILSKGWAVQFDDESGKPATPVVFKELVSWTEYPDKFINNYSGTAFYRNSFIINNKDEMVLTSLKLDSICNIATVKVNGIDCGTVWTPPYSLDITKAIKKGENKIEIEVTNTWRNRLIWDELNPAERKTWFNSPYKLKDKPLLPAGIIGAVKLLIR